MQVTYMGADDGGLLSNLAGIMSSMQGRGGFNVNPFSARDGLDYVPYDNFRINAHEGEAVLTKKQAEQWRGGEQIDITIEIPVVIDGHEVDKIVAKRVISGGELTAAIDGRVRVQVQR